MRTVVLNTITQASQNYKDPWHVNTLVADWLVKDMLGKGLPKQQLALADR